MAKKKEEKARNLRDFLQSLFKSETRSLIAWNLIIYKELTVKELTMLINKDASTITRNLRDMEDSNLVQISKIKTTRNFNINFWKLNPDIPLHKFGDFDEIISEALIKNDFEFIKLLLTTTHGILTSIFRYRNNNVNQFVENLLGEKEFLSLNLMDNETGQLFLKEMTNFVANFFQIHNVPLLSMDKVGTNSYLSFLLVSHLHSLE